MRAAWVPDRRRRRRDQPRLRAAHRVPRRRRALLRARRVLREGRVRRARDHGRAHRRRPSGAKRSSQHMRDEAEAARERERRAASAAGADGRHARAVARVRDAAARAVLRSARGRRHRRARAVAVVRSQEPVPALVGRRERQGRAMGERSSATSLRRASRATKRSPRAGALLAPRAVYGYFPAAGDGDDVIVYDPGDPRARSRASAFTRQLGGEHLCLADYLREPRGRRGERRDRAAGRHGRPRRFARDRRAAGRRTTTASRTFCTASPCSRPRRWPKRCTRACARELGLDGGRGKRYSWGYGACPDLSQHEIVWRLLDAERAIGDEVDRGVPDRPRAVDRRDRDPPSAGGVLQRRGRARTHRRVARRSARRLAVGRKGSPRPRRARLDRVLPYFGLPADLVGG